MAETLHHFVPYTAWINLSALIGNNARVSNSGTATLVYTRAIAQPAADSTLGHVLEDNNQFDYAVHAPEAIWVRALHSQGIVSATPGLALDLLDGALDIHDADVHRRAVNRQVAQVTGTSTTIATASAPNDYQISVANTAGFTVGDALYLDTGSVESTYPYITAITPGTPGTFTLDRRLDIAHAVGDTIAIALVDITAIAGSLAAPQEFVAGPEPGDVWHVTNLTLAMGHSSAGDFGLFGNLPRLTNGVLLRARIDGQYGTLTNWKTNGDINVDTGEVFFHTRSGGQGTFGTAANGAFKARTGAVIRLDGDTNDQFEVYVQDNLTALDFWNMKVQGYYASH